MPLTTIGADVDEAPDVEVDLSPQVAFDGLLPLNDLPDSHEVCLAQVSDPGIVGNPNPVEYLSGLLRPDAVNACERVLHALVVGDVHPCH